MSKPITRSKPAARAAAAMPTTPPAGPDRIASLPRNASASASPPEDCMKNSRVPSFSRARVLSMCRRSTGER